MMPSDQSWPKGFQTRTTPLVRGEFRISGDAGIVLSTVLGSCVAVCLHDQERRIGGMNHYLLPEGSEGGSASLKYGTHAMELLINHLLREGAARSRLQAKIFGGSRMSDLYTDIGARNAAFAMEFLENEGFGVVATDLGGVSARRVNFHPYSGSARVMAAAIPEDATQRDAYQQTGAQIQRTPPRSAVLWA